MNSTKLVIKRTKAIVALAVTLMSAAAMSTPAFAGDNKVYSGSMCDVQTPASNNRISRAGGVALNNGTSQVTVHCPVVRDNTSGHENGIGPIALVHVFNNNPSSVSITCSLRAYKPGGDTSFNSRSLTQSVTGGSPGTPGKFMFNFNTPVQQTPNGAYEVTCNLPAGTAVASYSVPE
jgi:hypothetical protein